MGDVTEKILHSDTIFQGKVLNLRIDTVELPDGSIGKREIIEHAEAVIVVPVTREGKLLLVKQYRCAVGRNTMELPAGNIDPGEAIEAAARRELQEETGYKAGEMTRLFSVHSTPGICTEVLHVFFASDLSRVEQNLDEGEFIEVYAVDWEKAMEMVWSGAISDAVSVAGILAVDSLMKKQWQQG